MKNEGGKYSLIIANNRYSDKVLSKLSAPVKDVGELAKILKNEKIGNFRNVTKLENCTSSKINESIEQFFSGSKKNDMLLFYFSGHGIKDDHGNLYLAATNTKLDALRSTAVPASFISSLMEESHSGKHIIILDCCFSGAFPKGLTPKAGTTIDLCSRFEGQGRIVLTSSNSMQYAFEGNKIVGKGIKESVFTHYLIQGLKTGEADLNGDGVVTIDELYDYIYANVKAELPQQTPMIWVFNKTGSIIVANNPSGTVKTPAEESDDRIVVRTPDKKECDKPAYHIAKEGWKSIKKGTEYAFFFLYTGIYKPDTIAKDSPELLEKESEALQEYFEKHLKCSGGKSWLGKKENYEQLILFPYHEKTIEKVIRCSFRMLLYKKLFDYEESILNEPLPLKLTLHFGPTQYDPNPANKIIVSSDINFLFHLGEHIEPNSIYVTGNAKEYVPEVYRNYLLPSGSFESRDLFRINFTYINDIVC